MNRKKKLLRVIAVAICLVLIMGVNVGISAAETESNNIEDVFDQNDLINAFKGAKDGDIIIIHGEVTAYGDLGIPDGKVTIMRMDADSRLTTHKGVGANFQNVIFDGSWMDNQYYSFITLQGDFSFKNCTFQNCGDPERTGGGNRIGGAVRVEAGEGLSLIHI